MRIIDSNTFFGFWPKRKVDVSIKKLLEIMEKHKIEKAISLSLRGIFYDYEQGNEETLKIARNYPQIIPAATVDLRKYFGKEKIVKKVLDQGFKVLRLFPRWQGWSMNYAPFHRLLEEISKIKISLMIDVSQPGETETGIITEISNLTKNLGVPVILACFTHWNYAETLAVMKDNPCIYAETSLFNTPDSFEIFIAEIEAGRLVFGSHTPLNYMRTPLLCLEKSTIPKNQKELIWGKNIQKILEGKVL